MPAETLVQFVQGMVQPRAAGRAHAPVFGVLIIQNIHGQDRRAGFVGFMQRRIIRTAQILTKPDDDGGGGH